MIQTYNQVVILPPNKKLTFADFFITFEGVFPVSDSAGHQLSMQTTDFTVIDKQGVSQRLRIGNGQLPNRPRSFTVAGKKFDIHTASTPEGMDLPVYGCVIIASN